MNIFNNRLNIELTDADVAAIRTNVAATTAIVPFAIGLSADEKDGMQGIDVELKVFCDDAIVEMGVHSAILPAFMTPLMVQKDLNLFEDFEQVIPALETMLGKFKDTQFLAGAEALSVCLIFYGLLKQAARAGVPGAQSSFDRLKKHFENRGGGVPLVAPVPRPTP